MPTKKIVQKTAVKKVTKKVVSKKVSPAKKVTKGIVMKKPLIYADNHGSFWVTDGQILDSLLALKNALDGMSKDVYQHHVSEERNDFAQWVQDVLLDIECANGLVKAKTPTAAKMVVTTHLKGYSY